jgi:hypothetical protein
VFGDSEAQLGEIPARPGTTTWTGLLKRGHEAPGLGQPGGRPGTPWAALEAENRRWRAIPKLTDGIGRPPPEQRALDLHATGRTDGRSGSEAQLALYMRLFAARTDVFAYH